MTVALHALNLHFKVRRVFAVSFQAISGAGYPGVASFDINENVIPYVGGEEQKVESEPRKMMGTADGGRVVPADFMISAHTNRVPVTDGHLVAISVEFDQQAGLDEVTRALRDFELNDQAAGLPSSPEPVIRLHEKPDRPQPRLDRMDGKGMTTGVGRLRPDPLFDYKFVVLSHNTIRGAAGGSIYNAELLKSQGWL
ncbi:MAG: aspartate-semialdehyde dehydrogenase, partial [Anaerolineales bacterium]|nr:aspartate-semialdehyde dehydrogenase [Anaerolineales bacterium]